MDSRCSSVLVQLRQAVLDGNTVVAEQLLAAEASAAGMLEQLLTAQDGPTGSTVLHIAAATGQTDVVRSLLSKGALIHAADKESRGPLHYAARSGHAEVVQLLLSAGSKLEQRSIYGYTALAEAARDARVHVLQALLQAGAAADTVPWGGKTTLILVAEDYWSGQSGGAGSSAYRCAELLAAAGAAVNAKDLHCCTALHYAAYNAAPSRASMVQMLLAAGADIHATNNNGETPLSWAARGARPAAVTLLLSAGAAADTKDCQGDTPLSVAAASASRWLCDDPPGPDYPARAAEAFDCFMAHISTQALAAAALVTAAAAAADLGVYMGVDESDSRQRAVIRRLLSAAVQQDISATRAALLLHEPGGFDHTEPREAATAMTGVLLDMWLAASAEQAELMAWLPTMQQTVVRVAAEQAEQHSL